MTWNVCPCCGWPLGNRSFAPPGGTAPCVADRYEAEDNAVRVVPVDLVGAA